MAKRRVWFVMPSWWVVLIAGSLFTVFSISIIRELVNSNQVRNQVQRLEDQVASETQRQRQLQDLIDYLGSPTFQEQEARLKLGLKKTGEQVIVVPATNESLTTTNESGQSPSTTTQGAPQSNPVRWWKYFFESRSTTLPTSA